MKMIKFQYMCFIALMLLIPLTSAAQDVIIQRNTTTTTTTTTTVTKPNKSQRRAVKPPKPTQPTQSSATTSATQTFTVNGVSFTMVRVEGGTFTMGATSEQGSDAESDESPTHRVTLSTYYIGETEVTQALWQAVMGQKPTVDIDYQWIDKCGLGDQYPAYFVSWNDCQSFISKLNVLTGKNFRLPTEAEWEFAARGGIMSKGYKYSGSDNLGSVAWYIANGSDTNHPVKTKQPNELGIYDMSGNVWEWCMDWEGRYSSSAQTNPIGPSFGTYRMCRGGCYSNVACCGRVSRRIGFEPDIRDSSGVGLRLAL